MSIEQMPDLAFVEALTHTEGFILMHPDVF